MLDSYAHVPMFTKTLLSNMAYRHESRGYNFFYHVGVTSVGKDQKDDKGHKVQSSYARSLATVKCIKCGIRGSLRPMYGKEGEAPARRLGEWPEGGATCGSCNEHILKPWFVGESMASKKELHKVRGALETERKAKMEVWQPTTRVGCVTRDIG